MSTRVITNDPYFDWLCRKINIGNRRGFKKYLLLVHALHEIKYRPGIISQDVNRTMDGLQLRVDFMTEHGYCGSSTDRSACTMLEFLIALARRMSFLMGSEENPHRTGKYFWIMIDNLGLSKLSDDRYNYLHGDFRVRDAADRINDRTYDPDGKGSLFPVKNPTCDMRYVEVWYQMQQWLCENSEISLDL